MAGIIEEDSIAPVDDIVVDEMTLECRDDCVPRCVRVPQEADAVIRSVELLFQELDDVFSILDAAGELPNMFIVVYADYEGEGQQWSTEQTLRLTEGGDRLVIEGAERDGVSRVRCAD